MKTTKIIKKSLVPAIASVVASFVILSGVSYAWFTTGSTAAIDPITVNIQSLDAVEFSISKTAFDWKSTFTSSDVAAAALVPAELKPLSTDGKANSTGNPDFFTGSISNGTLSALKNADLTETSGVIADRVANGTNDSLHMIVLDLYLRAPQAGALHLDTGSVVTDDASHTGKAYAAARVGFMVMGNNADSQATFAAFANTKAAADTQMTIWEPNSLTTLGDTARDNALAYKAIESVSEQGVITRTTSDITVLSSATNAVPAGNVISYSAGITKVRVYVWIEGEDAECLNAVASTTESGTRQLQVTLKLAK